MDQKWLKEKERLLAEKVTKRKQDITDKINGESINFITHQTGL